MSIAAAGTPDRAASARRPPPRGFEPAGGIDARTSRGQVSVALVARRGPLDVALRNVASGERVAESRLLPRRHEQAATVRIFEIRRGPVTADADSYPPGVAGTSSRPPYPREACDNL